jgi:8-oxo-dGTP pyrophosphatase MutT (NUDIX family)
MLNRLRQNIESTQTTAVSDDLDQQGNAAVLIALTNNEQNPSVILTKRAIHLSSHSGEVSFPGGKWEEDDVNLQQTALRESWEEIELRDTDVEILTVLPAAYTWQTVKVIPYVGVIPEEVKLTPNFEELDSIFQVPLSFFLEDKRIRTDIFPHPDGQIWTPAYEFEGYEIWGFTARLMITFLNTYFDANITCENPAPVKDWSHIRKQVEKKWRDNKA